MSEPYRTIEKATEGLFKDRGSKFLAYAYPISDVDEVKRLLEQLKTDHPAARHVCYAYQMGTDAETYRANDDGEPNGSSGLPILNQIKSKNVTNVLVAVVRYFGGTKLGVSGLVTAYKEAAKAALDEAHVVEQIPSATLAIRFPHSSIGDVERTVRQQYWNIKDQQFGMDCNWTIEVAEAELDKAKELFSVLPDVILLA